MLTVGGEGADMGMGGVGDKRDWADIQACLDGDEAGYERLVRRYEGQIGAQMRCLNRDPKVYEALVQDVFVEAYFGLKGYRGKGSFLSWLRRIAARVGYRYCRSVAKQPNAQPLGPELCAARSEGIMDSAQASALLQALLARLPPKDRMVLTLMYFEDCSIAEIARRTGWNHAMVKMRASRARRKLSRIIEAGGFMETLRCPK
jgi:RNA polymerase sigma factor (sigma-70 family)